MLEQQRAGPGVNSQGCFTFLPLGLEEGLPGAGEERSGRSCLGGRAAEPGKEEKQGEKERRRRSAAGFPLVKLASFDVKLASFDVKLLVKLLFHSLLGKCELILRFPMKPACL